MTARLKVLETRIMRDVHLALSDLEWRGQRACYLGRRNVGTFRHLHSEGVIKINKTGQADLTGFLCTGRALEVETKSINGELEPDQIGWRDLCLSMNVLWMMTRSPEEACAIVLAELDRERGA